MTGSRKERALLEWRGGDNAHICSFCCSHVSMQTDDSCGLYLWQAGLLQWGGWWGGHWWVFLERGDNFTVINTFFGIWARMPPWEKKRNSSDMAKIKTRLFDPTLDQRGETALQEEETCCRGDSSDSEPVGACWEHQECLSPGVPTHWRQTYLSPNTCVCGLSPGPECFNSNCPPHTHTNLKVYWHSETQIAVYFTLFGQWN